MKCPKCNAVVEGNSRFCGSCGQPVVNVIPAAATGTSGTATATASAPLTGAPSSLPPMLERMKNIVLNPTREWPVIAPEPTSMAQLYTGYVMPLAAFAALMSFIHRSLIGVNIPLLGVVRTPMVTGLLYTVVTFGFGLLGVLLFGWLVNVLAPTFGGTRDQRQALKVAAYSVTPGWLSSVLALSPILPTLLQLAALLYGLYVLYLGLPVLMRSPRQRAFGYTVTVVICSFLVGIVLMAVSFAFGRFGSGSAPSPAAAAAARDQGAATVGTIIGNALGTDEKGKAGLSAALSNLAKAGEQSGTSPTPSGQAAPDGAQANAAANSPDAAQSPLSAAGGLITALGGALGGSHRVEVVDFKTLTTMLPSSLPGMKRTLAQGENQGAVGVKTSSAKADYLGDSGAKIHIEISDLSGLSGLMDMAGALVQNTTSESASGYEKDQTISGRTVHEKYDANAKSGDLNVMLVKRFNVEVTGQGVDMSALEQSLGQIDLARLESMKDQGAQTR